MDFPLKIGLQGPVGYLQYLPKERKILFCDRKDLCRTQIFLEIKKDDPATQENNLVFMHDDIKRLCLVCCKVTVIPFSNH